MGDALRRYWMPALLSDELPQPDSDPLRVRLLGEDLIAFRDSKGRVGLLANNCPHRGASLFFGRNEEAGIRCVYHGWKFDVEGQCIDMPNEPADSDFKSKVKAVAYPCLEMAGVVWAYMGPPDSMGEIPDQEWMRLPVGSVWISKTYQECNYLQAIEGGVDTSHSSFLHREFTPSGGALGTSGYRTRSTAPRLEVVVTDYGYRYASVRFIKDEDKDYVRVYQFVMPFHQMRSFEGYEPGRPTVQGHMWMPIDDEHCWVYNWMYARDGQPIPGEVFLHEEKMFGRGPDDLLPGYRPKANRHNDYLIDRAVQRTKTYTGIRGINTQDMAVQEGMGPIYDRTQEHLGSADVAVITTRRLLIQAARDVEQGKQPQGSRPGSVSEVRPAEMVLPHGTMWSEAMERELIARW
jgi:phenylpropionate dioxygenase-like ring-hydroxylating dioxygenase large terminal subunit